MKHTFVFVAFTGEEMGLLGSKSYVKQMGEDLAKIKGMVNLDTLGLSDTKVWTTQADKKMLGLLGAVAKAMDLPIAAVNVDNAGSSDSESFRVRDVPALTLHSLTQETWKILHTDKVSLSELFGVDPSTIIAVLFKYGPTGGIHRRCPETGASSFPAHPTSP